MTAATESVEKSYRQKRKLLHLLERREELKKYGGHLYKIFPKEGPLSYENYPRHMEFFKAGAIHKERLFLAANRVGKTQAGAYEVACHLTGQYPEWWEGYRFEGPNHWLASGSTGETTRDAPQKELLGDTGELGTGMIARDLILKVTSKPGVPGGVGEVLVRHVPSGGVSRLNFKSYDQKRRAFEAIARHGIWFDEEPPNDVYGEALMRTMTTRGIMMTTLTPMQGFTDFISDFLDTAVSFTENKDSV